MRDGFFECGEWPFQVSGKSAVVSGGEYKSALPGNENFYTRISFSVMRGDSWEGRCSATRFVAASKCERTSDNVLREVRVKDKKCD